MSRENGPLGRLITRWLRVPAQPQPPAGTPGSVRVFNAARGFYRYRLAQWGLSQLGTVIGIAAGYYFVLGRIQFGPFTIGHSLIQIFELLGLGLFLIQLPFTFLMVDLDYRYRWYMITDRSLRIREGLLTVREQTMTLANIQNLSIRQGPLQRMLGISDLQVRTAGGGGDTGGNGGKHEKSADMHLGYFRGVDRAGEIRDAILASLRGQCDAGLGNPDDPLHPSAVPWVAGGIGGDPDPLPAALRLLEEARGLRTSLELAVGP
jgi:membrane protein YdbS with pleckstrin-like domain